MKHNTDAYGSYAVLIVNPIPRKAIYHALHWDLDWDIRRDGEFTRCGLGPVSDFRVHSFSLLDPARVRPCRRCYGDAS